MIFMVTYACQITIHPETFEIASTEHNCAEVLVDCLVQRLCRGEMRIDLFRRIWGFSVPINPRLDIQVSGLNVTKGKI